MLYQVIYIWFSIKLFAYLRTQEFQHFKVLIVVIKGKQIPFPENLFLYWTYKLKHDSIFGFLRKYDLETKKSL